MMTAIHYSYSPAAAPGSAWAMAPARSSLRPLNAGTVAPCRDAKRAVLGASVYSAGFWIPARD